MLWLVSVPGWLQAATPSTRITDEQLVKELAAYVDEQAARDAFSGAVLIAKGDKILFERAYGSANRAFNAPNQVDTKFNIGSMGKMFTGVAILQLVQQGRLSLQDTVEKWLPDYPDQQIAAKVTVHQLLTHTSGMGSFFNRKFIESSRAKYRTIQSHVPLFAGEPLQFEPGERWSYSNSGFIVLGLIVEAVSGETYYDYVREHIFKPAGMVNTDNYNVDDDVPNLALGYTRMSDDGRPDRNRPRRSNVLMHVARGSSAGGAYSTVEDMLRFSLALRSHRLLDQKHTELLITGKVPAPGGKYAYGMSDQTFNGVRIIGHNGGFAGISAQLDIYPELGYTVVVLSNYDEAADPIIRRARSMLTAHAALQP